MRVKKLQQQGKLEAGSSARSDDRHVGFFEFLIANGKLSREDILASVIDLIFAGVETTSNTKLWSLYMLGKNQDKQDILYEEITSAVLKPGEIPSADVIGKMSYLKAWIKESLRLYPTFQPFLHHTSSSQSNHGRKTYHDTVCETPRALPTRHAPSK
ncbi:hypothetical protein QZH41_001277 [Actinostola sp. cb2023]|nr:hypothetical protein QZH41_001277 [Actinostola sp. cb2023]